MTTRAYTRCTSGHYFIGEYCPFDGWHSKASKELTAAVKRLEAANKEVSLENLQQYGVSQETLARTVIMQFGSSSSAFEALSPEELVINGQALAQRNFDESFA